MWIQTTTGPFSITRSRMPGKGHLLQIRARNRDDLDRLRKRHLLAPIIETLGAGADYPYRIMVTREKFARLLVTEAMGIDYANFKNEVTAKHPSKAYVAALHDGWNTFSRYQEETEGFGPYGRTPYKAPQWPREIAEHQQSLLADWEIEGADPPLPEDPEWEQDTYPDRDDERDSEPDPTKIPF